MSTLPGGWRPERTADGSWTLRHPGHGEACHSRDGAWLEARERYVVPCRLGQRARRGGRARLRLLDVGTGLGVNIAAAAAVVANTDATLEVVTLENDPAVIRAAGILCRTAGPPPAGGSVAPREALWASVCETLEEALEDASTARPVKALPAVTIRLLLGDARETLAAEAPGVGFDAVFLDPFSPARAPELWSPAFLAEIAGRMSPRSWLSTYSSAFAVRRALALAGLRVGRGPRVGAKAEGTLASPDGVPPALSESLRRRLARAGPGAAEEASGRPG